MELRPYQVNILEKIKIKARLNDPVCVVVPCGAGKSILIAEICKGAATKNSKALVLAHRKELLVQNNEKFSNEGAIFCAGLNQKEIDLITFGSIASVFPSKEKFLGTKIILIDESHLIGHLEEGRYRELLSYLQPEIIIGFTATPYRFSSGENISIIGEDMFFKQAVISEQIPDLIAQGYLCPLTSKAAKIQADLTWVPKKSNGDYADAELEQAMLKIKDTSIQEIIESTQDRNSILIFASGVKHAQEIANSLPSAAFITGEDNDLFRDSTIQEFKAGRIKYLVNCEVLTTGFDFPEIDCIVILRATKSLSLFHQIVGRGLRPSPKKTSTLILDYGNNFLTHGTLDGFKLEQKSTSRLTIQPAPVKICPSCQHLQPLSIRVCKECFFEFPFVAPESKLGKNFYEGELFEGEIEAEFYAVEKIVYQPHKAKSGRDCMKVQYTTKVSNKRFYEWVSMPDIQACFEGNSSELFLAKKLAEWLEKRGLPQERTDTIDNIEDLLLSAHEYQHPVDISIVPDIKNPKYNRVEVLKTGEVQFEVHTEAPKLTSDSTFWK